ncbi:hypothetical protein NDU88_004950 [Pleurodeles waltl]|uniref:Uncharacterized protein n=1 Tax=Pleurodeles waltl TaxID=8319 RepID=A0AAV7TAV7_PLEWA|nr:hypothetical protein NDU88_004950 [Pleurodeles waltl]
MSALGSLEQRISEACLCRSFVRTTLGERCTRKEATERVGSNTSGLPDCPGCGAGEMGRVGMKLPQATDD